MEKGSYLLTIRAFDPDSNSNQIEFSLDEQKTKNYDWKSFHLDSKTGVLTLNTKLKMNSQSVYLVRQNKFFDLILKKLIQLQFNRFT